MKYLSYFGATALVFCILSSPAMAGMVDFGNTAPDTTPNAQTFTWDDGMGGTVITTAWYSNGGNNNFLASDIRQFATTNFFTFPWGLGVCSPGDFTGTNGSCSQSNPHGIDSEGPLDYILIDFSTPVILTEIVLTGLGTFAEHQVWGFSTDPNLGSLSPNALPAPDVNQGPTFTLGRQAQHSIPNLPSTPVDAVLVGAHPEFADNFFKLRSVSYNAVPIPDSALLFGTGLLGFIVFARRKNFIKK